MLKRDRRTFAQGKLHRLFQQVWLVDHASQPESHRKHVPDENCAPVTTYMSSAAPRSIPSTVLQVLRSTSPLFSVLTTYDQT